MSERRQACLDVAQAEGRLTSVVGAVFDRYGVVWAGDDSVDGEMEIFLQLLTGDGALIEPDGDPTTVPCRLLPDESSARVTV